MIFQMTPLAITPGLIVGAFVERMKFVPMMIFLVGYSWFVPVCYWVWGGGWLAEKGVMDFAGGIVSRTAGASALVLAKMLGARKGFRA